MDSSFVDHEEEVSTMNTYSCDSYGKTFKTLTNLKRHLDDTCSDKLFQYETCDKQFTAKKKSIVTSQAPSPAIGHNISLSPLWEEIPRRKQHVFPRGVYINTNKQDSYVNFVTSGSRITMHLSDI